ncbi:hypothetical protein ANN_06174 [Periplaneta americana]|uniref:Uncharacterized protein n=1 Tax=Periplaneta americana TaxID=6978 RepID=A0ABQ8TEP1_PERAM|nr:hypothetical protein ANN_06174 [Periplaneta americana]
MLPMRFMRSRTSQVLSVASLHWLKMDAPIPAPATCEVQSVMKFLNAQGIAPIEIYRQLCQFYGQADVDTTDSTAQEQLRHESQTPPITPDNFLFDQQEVDRIIKMQQDK